MLDKVSVRLTRNFESNLEKIALFLDEAGNQRAFDHLLDELSDTLIPNLERFPALGRLFLDRPVCSVEMVKALDLLNKKLGESEVREYFFDDYLVLYARFDKVINLVSIKHHCQLSVDFQSIWPTN
jgi:plasmid stabilization system protein ParE